MSAPSPRRPSTSLAETAYLTIRDRLVTLEIQPGAPISDELLAVDLEVGRTPVREALKRLESERLVIAYPRRGTFATDVHITDLTHISEVRRVLEPAAAAGAAQRATPADRADLGDLLDGFSRPAPTATVLMHRDLRAHRAVYAATHNPYLEDTLVRYDNLATRIWCLFIDRLPGLAGHVSEHGPLLAAIIAGDATVAADLAGRHVRHFEQAIRAVL